MRKFRLLAILTLLLNILLTDISAQTFYDNDGRAILYYNSANNTLFDYEGNPRYYFSFDNLRKINVYNFEGRHTAWLSEGILRDHEGKILASQHGRISNIIYGLLPNNPIEKIIPIKKMEQMAPLQPISKNEFSTLSLSFGSNKYSNAQKSPSYLQNDYSARATFKPYDLPSDVILNALKSLNESHNNLIRQGYIYDDKTDKYYNKAQYASLEANRSIISKSYYEVLAEAQNARPYEFIKSKRKTSYDAFFGSPELGVYAAKVIIKKSGRIRGFHFNHPQYGYMYFGVWNNPAVSPPYNEIRFIGDISKYRRSQIGVLGSSFLNGTGTLFWHKGMSSEITNSSPVSDGSIDKAIAYVGKGEYVKARLAFEVAAEKGNVYAMHTLGQYYEDGIGCKQDNSKSLDWFIKADKGGYPNSAKDIQRLKQKVAN